ncbi:MAG: DUF853 family protein [Nitrospirae bacterium]|nr:DUF853 family protein [Nitrospirota bacterium]
MNSAEKIAKKHAKGTMAFEASEKDEKHPYIHIVKHHEREGKYYAFFGIKVESIINKSYLNESKTQALFLGQMKFVQNLLTGHPGQSIELRYISRPDRDNWTRGKTDIVLFGRNISNSYDEAYLRAVDLWKNTAPVLNTEAEYYELMPIDDIKRFNLDRLPFEIKDIAEITRREESIPINRHERLYLPCPFVGIYSSLSRLCTGFLAHGLPIVYSITLQTVSLSLKEMTYLGNPYACDKDMGFLHSEDKQDDSPNDEDYVAKSTYLMKIQVASSETIPESLLDLIGSEITAPPMGIDVSTNGKSENSCRGGYNWYKPKTAKDFEIARNNLKYQDVNIWAPTIAARGIGRLRYIFDLVQACSAFRLPIAIGDENLHGVSIKCSVPVISPRLSEGETLLGISSYGTAKNEIRLKGEDRRKHCYIQGATGTGKTTVIINMALQDINQGNGVIVLDYTGDLSKELLSRIPKGRVDDVIYFNPSDTDYPVGFNPLFYDPKSPLKDLMKENIIGSILSWLKKEYEKDTMGPVFYQNVRNALLLVMADDEPATIIDFVNIFFEKELFERKLKKINNPLARKFWTEVYDSDRYKTMSDNGVSLLQYIICKFSPIVDLELTRNIFGQRDSKLDIRNIIDNRKILICNLSKGLIGEFNAKFLGLMVISKIEQAALSRADMPEEKRVDSCLYLDECHNLQTEHFYNMLSEMRKYRVNITLANQHFSQLDERMRDSVLGNCGTVVLFKTGVKDAEMLEPILHPYNKSLLLKLPYYHAITRMVENGVSRVLTMETLPLSSKCNPEIMNAVIELSRFKFGRRKESVELDHSEKSPDNMTLQ